MGCIWECATASCVIPAIADVSLLVLTSNVLGSVGTLRPSARKRSKLLAVHLHGKGYSTLGRIMFQHVELELLPVYLREEAYLTLRYTMLKRWRTAC